MKEYPGPKEGREAEEHLGLAEYFLGQGTKELTIISWHNYCLDMHVPVIKI